jgi:RNAse (barnase) inhibitor barstar
MSNKIETLLAGDAPSGVYKLPARASIESVRHAAEKANMQFAVVDGKGVDDKASFIKAIGESLAFPSYSAKNWDAFEESMNDLSWLPSDNGYVIVFDHAGVFEAAQPKAFMTALDILGDVCKSWGDAGTPMLILVRGAKSALNPI